jgi:hypothetical protein
VDAVHLTHAARTCRLLGAKAGEDCDALSGVGQIARSISSASKPCQSSSLPQSAASHPGRRRPPPSGTESGHGSPASRAVLEKGPDVVKMTLGEAHFKRTPPTVGSHCAGSSRFAFRKPQTAGDAGLGPSARLSGVLGGGLGVRRR